MKGHVIDGGRYVQILINNGEVETIERKGLNRKAFTPTYNCQNLGTPTIVSRLREKFLNREVFTRGRIVSFFQEYEPDLKEGTFGWRIYDLKKKQIIKDVRKRIYILEYKQNFRPEPDPIINQIGSFLQAP